MWPRGTATQQETLDLENHEGHCLQSRPTLGTLGAAAWVVPWVPLRKAPVLADAMPGRGAGQSHFLTASVMRPAGRKPSSWVQRMEARAHPLPACQPPSFPFQGPRKATSKP